MNISGCARMRAWPQFVFVSSPSHFDKGSRSASGTPQGSDAYESTSTNSRLMFICNIWPDLPEGHGLPPNPDTSKWCFSASAIILSTNVFIAIFSFLVLDLADDSQESFLPGQ